MTEITEANEFEKNLLFEYGNMSCDGSAFKYARDNDDVTVKVGEMENGMTHCWVYDADLDLTIDVAPNGVGIGPSYWEGDEHPHCRDVWDTYTSETEDEFKSDYAGCPTFVI